MGHALDRTRQGWQGGHRDAIKSNYVVMTELKTGFHFSPTVQTTTHKIHILQNIFLG